MTERNDAADWIDQALAAEPIENAEANEPIDPMDNALPIDPIDNTELRDPIDRIESCDHNDQREFTERAMRRRYGTGCSPAAEPGRRRPVQPWARAITCADASRTSSS